MNPSRASGFQKAPGPSLALLPRGRETFGSGLRRVCHGHRERRDPGSCGWRVPGIGLWLLVSLLGTMGFVLSGCSGPVEREEGASGERSVVFVATIHPLAAILEKVTEPRARVVRLLPPGASPHTYEPSPSDVRIAGRAPGLFYVSDELDGWASRLPAEKRVMVIDLVPPSYRLPMDAHSHDHAGEELNLDEPGHEEHREAEPDEGKLAGEAAGSLTDPHFWTDPLTVKATLPGLVDRLGALDPEGRDVYARNAERFAAELEFLDAEVSERLASVKGKTMVLFHPSFQYLLRRYGLRLAGLIEEFPGKEPSPRDLQALIQTMREAGVRAIFSEPQLSRRVADALGEAAGLPVYLLDPVGGVEGRVSYRELILYNVDVLQEALQ